MEPTVIPTRLMQIIEDFEMAEGREKLELLLDYSERMPPLPERISQHHDQMNAVPECMTPVFVQAEREDDRMRFYFDIPRESPTIRGYVG